jgi:hypothetical protein
MGDLKNAICSHCSFSRCPGRVADDRRFHEQRVQNRSRFVVVRAG